MIVFPRVNVISYLRPDLDDYCLPVDREELKLTFIWKKMKKASCSKALDLLSDIILHSNFFQITKGKVTNKKSILN